MVFLPQGIPPKRVRLSWVRLGGRNPAGTAKNRDNVHSDEYSITLTNRIINEIGCSLNQTQKSNRKKNEKNYILFSISSACKDLLIYF